MTLSDKIIVALMTCERFELTKRTVESFLAYNRMANFEFVCADDGSTDPQFVGYAERYGARMLVQHETRKGLFETLEELIAAIEREYGPDRLMLLLQNDWESVRTVPLAVAAEVFADPDVGTFRLCGQWKERGHGNRAFPRHWGLPGKPKIDWQKRHVAGEEIEVGQAHWGHPPAITRVGLARELTQGVREEKESWRRSTGFLTARVVENVMFHIGAQETTEQALGLLDPFSPPAITAMCATYGRFERLRDSVACFLLQEYGPKRMLICNDAPHTLALSPAPIENIEIWNVRERFPTLGHKRQAMLERIQTPAFVIWDDDDLHLPHRLCQVAEALAARPDLGGIRLQGLWWLNGKNDKDWKIKRITTGGTQDCCCVFDTAKATAAGGFGFRVSGQIKDLMSRLEAKGGFDDMLIGTRSAYVYRWKCGAFHISGRGNRPGNSRQFAKLSQDLGNGEALIPSTDPIGWAKERMRPAFERLALLIPAFLRKQKRARDLAAAEMTCALLLQAVR